MSAVRENNAMYVLAKSYKNYKGDQCRMLRFTYLMFLVISLSFSHCVVVYNVDVCVFLV